MSSAPMLTFPSYFRLGELRSLLKRDIDFEKALSNDMVLLLSKTKIGSNQNVQEHIKLVLEFLCTATHELVLYSLAHHTRHGVYDPRKRISRGMCSNFQETTSERK